MAGEVSDRIKGPWSPEEDELLKKLVERHGGRNWSVVSQSVPGRSGKSCRLRWCNQLSPEVEHRPFTKEEDEKILEAHRRFGNKWAKIARLLNGRTDNAVKNHWNSKLKRKVLDSGGRSDRPKQVLRRAGSADVCTAMVKCEPRVRSESFDLSNCETNNSSGDGDGSGDNNNSVSLYFPVERVESPVTEEVENGEEDCDREMTLLTLRLPGRDSSGEKEESTAAALGSGGGNGVFPVREKEETTKFDPKMMEAIQEMIRLEVRNYFSGVKETNGGDEFSNFIHSY